jgi:hypothetical protein
MGLCSLNNVVHTCSFVQLKYVKIYFSFLFFTTLGVASSKFIFQHAFKCKCKFYSHLRICRNYFSLYGWYLITFPCRLKFHFYSH